MVDELARRRGRPTRRAGSRVLPVYRTRYCIREGSSRLLDGSTVSCLGEPAPDLLVAKTPRLCPEVVAACEGDDETQPAHSPRCTATPAHSPRCTATLCHGSSVPRAAESYTFTQTAVPPGRNTPQFGGLPGMRNPPSTGFQRLRRHPQVRARAGIRVSGTCLRNAASAFALTAGPLRLVRTRRQIRVRRYRRRATADLLFGRIRTRAAWLACDCHLYAPNSIVCR